MTILKAFVRDGRIETDQPIDLPDGTELHIPIPESASGEAAWDNSPEGIAAWLKWYESLEPLIFTDEERAALEADRQARKEWDKAHFEQYAEDLRKLWE